MARINDFRKEIHTSSSCGTLLSHSRSSCCHWEGCLEKVPWKGSPGEGSLEMLPKGSILEVPPLKRLLGRRLVPWNRAPGEAFWRPLLGQHLERLIGDFLGRFTWGKDHWTWRRLLGKVHWRNSPSECYQEIFFWKGPAAEGLTRSRKAPLERHPEAR